MKKMLSVILAAVLVFSLAACYSDLDVAGDDAFSADVVWYTFADTFLASVRASMDDQLADFPNINVTQIDSMDDQTTQLDQLRTAVLMGADALVINIVITGAEDVAMEIIDIARDAGIPAIFFNREVSDDVINSYDQAVFIGTDAAEAGMMQGVAIANFLLEGDNLELFDLNGDGYISYVMFRGEHGNAEAFFRTFYSVYVANQMLAPYGVTLVPSPANEVSTLYADDGISNYFLYGNWSADNAFELMSTALVAHSLTDGSIELIIANNDDQAIGAIAALSEQGFNTGAADQIGYIPVFGVDATDVAMVHIRDGRMTGTILQDGAAMAAAIIFLLDNLAEGRDMFHNTGHFIWDDGVAKIRIPHAIAN